MVKAGDALRDPIRPFGVERESGGNGARRISVVGTRVRANGEAPRRRKRVGGGNVPKVSGRWSYSDEEDGFLSLDLFWFAHVGPL
jgi:hypothetical protein